MTDLADAARSIAEAICGEAVWHGARCNWIAPVRESGPGRRPRIALVPLDGTLHKGTAGVALFLAEAHRATGATDARRTALGAARHAVRAIPRAAQDAGPGLYAGAPGVAWAAGRVATLMDDAALARAAAALTEDVAVDGETDLMRGLAGSVLALLAADGGRGARARGAAERLGEMILARAEPDGDALSWATGRGEHRLENLLGMGHGSAGIGLALAELAAVTGRDDLAAAVRAAFAHGRARFDAGEANWPDLRRTNARGAAGPSFSLTWCQGSAGGALARLRASALLGDAALGDEARIGLETTARLAQRVARADGAEFCLCHGLAGACDVLREGARAFPAQGSGWAALAEEVLREGLARYPGEGRPWPCGPAVGSDPSLMLGTAGVGHALLRMTDASIPSVLAITAAEV